MRRRLRLCIVVLLLLGQLVTYVNSETDAVPECKYVMRLTSPEPKEYGEFGWTCVVHNDTIIVGEHGAVWFFDTTGNVTRVLKPRVQVNSSRFGYALTLFNDLLLVGDPTAAVEGLTSAGMVHVYSIDGEYIKSLAPIQPMINAEFGRSLACNDDLLVIGEPGPQIMDENITSRVHVYDENLLHQFTVQQSEARTGSFGMSLAINKDTIIVGEPYFSTSTFWNGVVYLYDHTGKLKRNITSPIPPVTYSPSNFGFRVSADDTVIAVCEIRGDIADYENAGRAYIFNDEGEPLANLTSLKPIGGAGFGYPLVWRGLTIVNDYVRVDEFSHRVGAAIYDENGCIVGAVTSRDYEYIRGTPIVFNDEYVILGDITREEDDQTYAGQVFVLKPPEGLWEDETSTEDYSIPTPVIYVLTGLILYSLVAKGGEGGQPTPDEMRRI